MAFFDFKKVAEIEETFFNEFAENEYDELVDVKSISYKFI